MPGLLRIGTVSCILKSPPQGRGSRTAESYKVRSEYCETHAKKDGCCKQNLAMMIDFAGEGELQISTEPVVDFACRRFGISAMNFLSPSIFADSAPPVALQAWRNRGLYQGLGFNFTFRHLRFTFYFYF